MSNEIRTSSDKRKLLGKDDPEYFVIKMGDHPLELPPTRRDWHLTHLQASAILLLTMGALTALVIWLIVSHSQL